MVHALRLLRTTGRGVTIQGNWSWFYLRLVEAYQASPHVYDGHGPIATGGGARDMGFYGNNRGATCRIPLRR
jgi:hypothetical protein